MAFLSHDEQQLLAQANRRLTNMRKRAKLDSNVDNAIAFAESDISIASKGKYNRFKITQSMTERQKKAMLRSAESLIESPYSTKKETEALYRRQRNTFAERYGLTKQQASKMIDLFNKKKNPEVAEAWEKLRNNVNYESIVPILKNEEKLGDVVRNIGDKKFGLMMRLFTEGSMQSSEYNFANFLQDREIVDFFEKSSTDEIEAFIDVVKNKGENIEELTTDEIEDLILK